MKLLSLSTCAALSTVCLAAPLLASEEPVSLSLDLPGYTPIEAFNLTISGTPDTAFGLLLDTDPGPIFLPDIGALNIGFSPALVIIPPLFIPESGQTEILCDFQCEDTGLVGKQFFIQAVSLAPPYTDVCVSNTVVLEYQDEFDVCGPCDECKGGLTELCLRYLGDSTAWVKITKDKIDDETFFDASVAPGGTFCLTAEPGDKLEKDLSVYVDGVLNTEDIHTSCSQPIEPGLEYGDFRILAAVSKDNGRVCPAPPPGQGSCDDGKPFQLTMRYTGEDCSASQNTQDDDKALCDGDPAGASPVYILAFNDDGILFEGEVSLNGTFLIDSAAVDASKLKSQTFVDIYDMQGGNVLQAIEFHTSCSQDLAVGNQFGSLILTEFFPEL